MNLHQDVTLSALEMDELTLGRSPVFRWLRPSPGGKTAASLLLGSGLTPPTDQLRLTRLLIDKYLLSGMGFAAISHSDSPEFQSCWPAVWRDRQPLIHHPNLS